MIRKLELAFEWCGAFILCAVVLGGSIGVLALIITGITELAKVGGVWAALAVLFILFNMVGATHIMIEKYKDDE